jgi:hypothetical protein
MPSFRILLPILLMTQLVAAPAQRREDRTQSPRDLKGLPIRYTVQGRAIDVPPGTRHLGWKPEPLRELTVELLEPPMPGEDMAGEDIPEEGLGPIPERFREYALKKGCFDLWMYGDVAVEQRTVWLLSALSAKVVAVRDRGLSPAEEEKLILAGRGDIKHFFDRVEAHRPAFEAARKDLVEGQAFLRTIQPLSIEFQLGLYDFGSLFTKTLRKIENDRKASR